MKCPFCSSENTRVIDSRPADDNNSIRRRRSMIVPRLKQVYFVPAIRDRYPWSR